MSIPDTVLTREQRKNREEGLSERIYKSPRVSTETPDCGFPMTFDQYALCSYNCSYCFATQIKISNVSSTLEFKARVVKAVSVEQFRRIMSGEPHPNTFEQEMWNGFIRHRIPVHWGGLGDPFDQYEKKFGVGLQCLDVLKELEYPTFICFKGDTIMLPEYREMIADAKNLVFQVSINNLNDALSKRIEKGAPVPSVRLQAMRMLVDMGKTVYWRMRPFVIGMTDVDMEKLFDAVSEATRGKCMAMSTEFMALTTLAEPALQALYDDMSKHLGYDVTSYYKALSRPIDSNRRLNPEVKEKHVLKAWELCRKHGMSFAISDPHFKELNDSCNCCGVPKTDPILGTYTIGQQTEAILIAKRRGHVRWGDMAQAMDWSKEFCNAGEYFNLGNKKGHDREKFTTIFEHLRGYWNDPNAAASPYRYFWGKLKPRMEPDENGDLIYDYIPSRYEIEDPRFTRTDQTQKNCGSCGACGVKNVAYKGQDGHRGNLVQIEPETPRVETVRTRKLRKRSIMAKLFR